MQGFSSPETHNTAPPKHNPGLSSYGIPFLRRTVWTPVPRSPVPPGHKPRDGPPSFLHLPPHVCPEPLLDNPFPLIPQPTLLVPLLSAARVSQREGNPPAILKSPPTLTSEMPPGPSLTTSSFICNCHFLSGPLYSSRSFREHAPSSHTI